jgi:hypothetical protein
MLGEVVEKLAWFRQFKQNCLLILSDFVGRPLLPTLSNVLFVTSSGSLFA